MPSAAMRPCLGSGCTVVGNWPRGRCPACAKTTNQRAGTAASRGYGSHWQAFRLVFIGQLVNAGISPVCGATLPGGPRTADSECKAQGVLNGLNLHLDHEPPLTDEERRDVKQVCNPLRIQLLCGAACHARKTRRQQLGRTRKVWSTEVGALNG